ncbi:ATP-binding protein [Streptomyces sp. OfavH-34-F]|uniref:ATP-binding protein n=1 Tax=Streptomyces sp. OfavH-34-F TaxID=2917760 RepID=UPI001EF21DB2|nr:ATP-binding protein [Streptomyces sp. OfavH-34-F]MCG7526242.1 ATP-binding protein [Streptomyces sp. OfavH-34-F]
MSESRTAPEALTEAVPPPARAADAREMAAAFVAALDPPPSATAVQDLLLVVSELVTNAVRHAGSVTGLAFGADERALYVRVTDPSAERPRERAPDLTGAGGGFGWPLILRLAGKVTVRNHRDSGKTVLVALAR